MGDRKCLSGIIAETIQSCGLSGSEFGNYKTKFIFHILYFSFLRILTTFKVSVISFISFIFTENTSQTTRNPWNALQLPDKKIPAGSEFAQTYLETDLNHNKMVGRGVCGCILMNDPLYFNVRSVHFEDTLSTFCPF